MIETIGRYMLLMKEVFTRPQRGKLFWKQVIDEIYYLGVDSVVIVAIISIFVGAAVTIQMKFNLDVNTIMPLYTIGFAAKKSIILEFSPTIISLILAGKMGSHIASELGTMRISEQIDALEVMGINSANFLILPKIIACVLFNPILIMLSIVLSLFGGWAIGVSVAGLTTYEYVYGLQFDHNTFDLVYAIIKTICFAFLIASVSSFYGYNVKGGSLEVGKTSTQAVIYSSIAVIFCNLVVTQILLA
ncbi:MAG: ABC transporter permease [Bacteroidales bacterium]